MGRPGNARRAAMLTMLTRGEHTNLRERSVHALGGKNRARGKAHSRESCECVSLYLVNLHTSDHFLLLSLHSTLLLLLLLLLQLRFAPSIRVCSICSEIGTTWCLMCVRQDFGTRANQAYNYVQRIQIVMNGEHRDPNWFQLRTKWTLPHHTSNHFQLYFRITILISNKNSKSQRQIRNSRFEAAITITIIAIIIVRKRDKEGQTNNFQFHDDVVSGRNV